MSTQDQAVSKTTTAATDLPEDLRGLVVDVLGAAARQDAANSEYAYRMAILARSASGRRLSRGAAMAACAEAAKVSRQTLELYVTITSRWNPLTVRRLLEGRDSHGRAVTISHLRRIAHAPPSLRTQLVESILGGDFDLHHIVLQMTEE